VLEQVLKLLRENLNGETFKVDHPRRTLEEFFLDVVARAKSESAETAGAASGGRIADYLSAPADETSAVLEQLVQELPAHPRQEDAPVVETAVVQDEAVSAKLDSLTGEVEVKAKEEPAPAAAQEEAAKLDEINQKLNDILGNRK
jgi:ABC-2 type transport system ATP-binding protein